jgi:Flp pilus assembly protein TadG
VPGRRRPSDRDRGALTLSYVIIVPVFLAAVMVIIQASLWYLARQAALAAARQGADAARVLDAAPGAGPRAALQFARSAGSGYLLNPAATAAGSTATTIQMRVTGRVPSLVPGLAISISQVVQAPVERFTTP